MSNLRPAVGLVVDDEGNVTYDFDGHVHARGLDLDAGTDESPPADHRLRWLRPSDGAVVAELLGYVNPTVGPTLDLRAWDPDDPTRQAALVVEIAPVPRVRVLVTDGVATAAATVLDANGDSDFT